MILSILLALLTVAADQLTKYWAKTDLKLVQDIPLWDGVFHFHYAENTGAAFSLLSGHSLFFFILTAAVVVAILWFLIRRGKNLDLAVKIALGLIMGGAIGNLIDRMAYGYVIDFLYFKLINFAIFNVADSCLVIGCILMAVYIIFFSEKKAKEPQESKENGSGDPPAEG